MSLNDGIKKMRTMKVYKALLSFLDQKGWKYSTQEGELIVHLGFVGEDIPMPIIFDVDENVQILKVISIMPFGVSEEHFLDMSMATTYVNSHLPFGTFMLDMEHKVLSYRNSTCFIDGEIGAETFDLLIDVACTQIDRYNDRFFALEKGMLTLEDFISAD